MIMIHYQNMLCIGDSQTFGARSYGCYPLHLAQMLTQHTPYQWRTINRSVNGYTARNLWFKLNEEIDTIRDTYQSCVLIGTNDVGNHTPIDLFAEYYRQIIRALLIRGYRAVFCGEIPQIYADGHIFFAKETIERRKQYNAVVAKVVAEFSKAVWVPMVGLNRDCYVDPVHFNEDGNRRVAESFCEVIVNL